MNKIGIGIIGAGFMGSTHAASYKSITNIFGQDIIPELEIIADVNEESAKNTCDKYGFKSWTTSWMDVVTNPNVDIVNITTPNSSHIEIAIAAAKNGKHIYCEKPLAMNGEEAERGTKVVEDADIITMVGFNYLHNPVQAYAKELLASGELGKIVSFRGTFDQDFYAEEDTLHTWRFLKSASTSGALGDLSSHTISLSQYLVGDIKEVCGMTDIVFSERPDPKDTTKMLPVENDDLVQFMFRYDNGAAGVIVSNRVACGRKIGLTYEIQCTKGNIVFTQERMNELKIYRHDDKKTERGFKTVLVAPGHGYYDKYYDNAGISLGFADQKVIEAYTMLKSVADNKKSDIDFNFGCKIDKVIDAVLLSAEERRWVDVI